jgi:hypothetical protein
MIMTRAPRALAVVLLFGAGSCPAATDTREACRADAVHYCPNEVAARDRKAVRRCLRDNLDKASDTCKAAIAGQQAGADAKARR